ncbi:MAG: OB-fold nucleic acid binding domain-containing protein, partial [Myxococcota bacterium]
PGGGRNQEVSLAGIITELRERPLKSGNGRMAFARLEDLSGACEVLVFSRCFAEYEELLKSDEPIWIRGAVHLDGDDEGAKNTKLRANQVMLLSDVRANAARDMELVLDVELVDEKSLQRLKDLLRRSPGDVPTRMTLRQVKHFETRIALPQQFWVSPTEELLGGVKRLFGNSVVRLT